MQVSLICVAVSFLTDGSGAFLSPAIWPFMCSATLVWHEAQLCGLAPCLVFWNAGPTAFSWHDWQSDALQPAAGAPACAKACPPPNNMATPASARTRYL